MRFRITSVCALALALGTFSAACARSNESGGVITLVTHSSPGGGSDVFLREMVPHLSRIMGTTFVVDNLHGGSGARAIAALANEYPRRFTGHLHATLHDGTHREVRQACLRGGAEVPMSTSALEQKFMENARHGGWTDIQA